MNWKIIKNSERIGALNNIVNAINLHNCTDEDVIVLIDADDWLATSDAFQILVKYYREGAKATYGSRIVGKDIEVPEGPENISRDWRSNRGNLIHLHTFMFEIYKHINHDVSFIDKETKKYYTSAHDRVIMTNIAELAGSSIRRISEAVYASSIR
jgi:glycosyltransferase involved in cell wall biosynthesis